MVLGLAPPEKAGTASAMSETSGETQPDQPAAPDPEEVPIQAPT